MAEFKEDDVLEVLLPIDKKIEDMTQPTSLITIEVVRKFNE